MDKKKINEILIEVQEGKEDAFEELFNLTNKGLFSFVYLIVKDKYDAEDIVQNTYIKLKRSISAYTPNTNPTAWIFQIAKNLSYDFLRQDKNKKMLSLEQYDMVDKNNFLSERIENLYLHNLMIENLDDESRQIISLHLIEGYKHREIAKLLKLPLGTVLWKYNRALKTLKEKIKEEER